MARRFPSNRENMDVSNNPAEAAGEGEKFDVEDGYRRRLKETDPHRLSQRQKAIDKGKNTRAYQNYLKQVPKFSRPKQKNEEEFPNTPDKHEICSVRSWAGKVRHWRLRLHKWDPAPEEGEEIIEVPTQTMKGIKKGDTSQGLKRDREANPKPLQRKRQSLSSLGNTKAGGSGDVVDVAQEAAGNPAREDGATSKSIFDDWDEADDIAL